MKVAQAVNDFLNSVKKNTLLSTIPIGEARLSILQDESIVTTHNFRFYEFIGSVEVPLPPNLYKGWFEKGDSYRE